MIVYKNTEHNEQTLLHKTNHTVPKNVEVIFATRSGRGFWHASFSFIGIRCNLYASFPFTFFSRLSSTAPSIVSLARKIVSHNMTFM